MKTITYKTAAREDAQAILTYLDQIGRESDNLTFGEEGIGYTLEAEEKMLETLSENPNATMILAFDGDIVVSVANLSASVRERTKHIAVLGISVLKDYHRQGIGQTMMEKLITFARKAPDTEIIHLEVRSDNAPAIALYNKFGFKHFAHIPKAMKIKGAYISVESMALELWTIVSLIDEFIDDVWNGQSI